MLPEQGRIAFPWFVAGCKDLYCCGAIKNEGKENVRSHEEDRSRIPRAEHRRARTGLSQRLDRPYGPRKPSAPNRSRPVPQDVLSKPQADNIGHRPAGRLTWRLRMLNSSQ